MEPFFDVLPIQFLTVFHQKLKELFAFSRAEQKFLEELINGELNGIFSAEHLELPEERGPFGKVDAVQVLFVKVLSVLGRSHWVTLTFAHIQLVRLILDHQEVDPNLIIGEEMCLSGFLGEVTESTHERMFEPEVTPALQSHIVQPQLSNHIEHQVL